MKNNSDFNFQDLFIFDLANNHQGDQTHAEKIIHEIFNKDMIQKSILNKIL